MMWLVTGPTCAGKSTLAYGSYRETVIGAPVDVAVAFPSNTASHRRSRVIYHYNILRRLSDARVQQLPVESGEYRNFQADEPWRRLLENRAPKQAMVLVVSRPLLLERISSRSIIEQHKASKRRPYPREFWGELLAPLDLNLLYSAWCEELREQEIDYQLIDSSDYEYRSMTLAELQGRDLNIA